MNWSTQASATDPVDITDLLFTGQHPVLRTGMHLDALRPLLLWTSSEAHSPGIPLGGDVMLEGTRFCIGLDETGCLSYWVLKRSLQDRPLLFRTANKELLLDDIDAFAFLSALEELRLPYAREIWRNSVCVVTVLQSDVSISFDLAPSVARGYAAIERSDPPLYIGGDVFHKLTYEQG